MPPQRKQTSVSHMTEKWFPFFFLSDGIKRRFIRNPGPGTPTIFTGPKEECNDKDFIPQLTKKGESLVGYGVG